MTLFCWGERNSLLTTGSSPQAQATLSAWVMDKPEDSCEAWGLAEAATAAAICSAAHTAPPRTTWLESGAHLQAQPHQQVQLGESYWDRFKHPVAPSYGLPRPPEC